MCIVLDEQHVLAVQEMHGRSWKSKRSVVRKIGLSINDSWGSFQARYFKHMLKASDHLEKVARLRVSSHDIAHLRLPYEVRL